MMQCIACGFSYYLCVMCHGFPRLDYVIYAPTLTLIPAVNSIISPLHIRVAGSGVQVPSNVQLALILPAGTYPGAHMKNISAPNSELWYISMKPFRGPMGIPQLTGRKGVMVVAN